MNIDSAKIKTYIRSDFDDIGITTTSSDCQTEKIYTKYRLKSPDGKYSIFAKVSEGLITLETHKGDKEFVFLKSKKEDLKAIAELFLRAVEL